MTDTPGVSGGCDTDRQTLQSSRRSTALVGVGLGVILLAALLLRLWGLDYGLPHPTARPDEEQIVRQAQSMLVTGGFPRGGANYPGLFKCVSAGALGAYYYAGRLTGRYGDVTQFLRDIKFSRPNRHYLACRAASAIFGVGTVLLTFLLARRMVGEGQTGLAAAAFLATAFLHVRDSHFATVDVAMTFFVTLSLLFASAAARNGTSRASDLAGLAAGLAAATKYNGGLVIVAALAACASPLVCAREWRERGRALWRTLRCVGFAVVGFAIGSPYTLLRPMEAWDELWRISAVLTSKPGPPGLVVHPTVTLPEGVGWPVYVAALAGIACVALTRSRPRLLLLLFAAAFFASVASNTWVMPRYVMPLLPPLCVLAALALYDLARVLGRRWLVLPAAFVLLLPSLSRSIQYDRLASRKDTRVLAAEWVELNVASGTPVSVCTGYGAVAVPRRPAQWPTYPVQWTSCRVDETPSAHTRILITHEHPFLFWSPPVGHFRKVLGSEWQERAVFNPFKDDRPERSYYFTGDAFYVPYTALDSVARGGPIVRIWERAGPH